MVNIFYLHSKNLAIILIFFGILASWTCTKSEKPKADTVFINGHTTSGMPWIEVRVGSKRIKGAYAGRSFLDTGGTPYFEL